MSDARTLTLRAARRADLPALLGIDREAFGADAWSEESLGQELAAPDRVAEVAELDAGPPAGYAVVRLGEVADLQRIAVAERHRRRGVGRALLRSAARTARDAGADRMLLEVAAGNAAALRLYGQEGWVVVDQRPRYYRDGSDALVLRLGLGPAWGGRR